MLAIVAAVSLATPLSQAQTYPNKPVRIISPYSPGGLGDLVPRAIAPAQTESMGQQFLVDNRPGASQAIGMQAAAKSLPDGYTMVYGSVTSLAINVSANFAHTFPANSINVLRVKSARP